MDGLEGQRVGYFLLSLAGDGLGPGQDAEPEVAASLRPFVVLLGEDGADEADDGSAVGEDADDVGTAADRPVEPFV